MLHAGHKPRHMQRTRRPPSRAALALALAAAAALLAGCQPTRAQTTCPTNYVTPSTTFPVLGDMFVSGGGAVWTVRVQAEDAVGRRSERVSFGVEGRQCSVDEYDGRCDLAGCGLVCVYAIARASYEAACGAVENPTVTARVHVTDTVYLEAGGIPLYRTSTFVNLRVAASNVRPRGQAARLGAPVWPQRLAAHTRGVLASLSARFTPHKRGAFWRGRAGGQGLPRNVLWCPHRAAHPSTTRPHALPRPPRLPLRPPPVTDATPSDVADHRGDRILPRRRR